MREYYEKALQAFKNEGSFPKVLVATKCDVREGRVVSRSQGEELAKEMGCPYFETSAKTGENVDDAFFQAVREYWSFPKHHGNSDDQKNGKCIVM